MNGKYICKHCNYATDRLFNYNKHIDSKRHKATTIKQSATKILPIRRKIKDLGESSPKDETMVACTFCNKGIGHKKNLKRHLKTCTAKLDQDEKASIEVKCKESEEECSRLRKELMEVQKQKDEIDEERKRISKTLLDLVDANSKSMINQTIVNNFIAGDAKFDINYINENCKNPYDYVKVMEVELSEDEKKKLLTESHVEGPYQLIHGRCIEDVPFDKRCIHLLDLARKKYYVYFDQAWQIDNGGKKVLTDLVNKVIPFYIKEIGTDIEHPDKCAKLLSALNTDQKKILEYLGPHILLKNNEDAIRNALKLIKKNDDD